MRPRRFSHSRHGHFYRRATRRRTGVRLCSHVSQTTDSQTFWILLNLHEASVMQKRKPLRFAILANACVGKRSRRGPRGLQRDSLPVVGPPSPFVAYLCLYKLLHERCRLG